MSLLPVRNYEGTKYPDLAEFVTKHSKSSTVTALTLAAALSLLAILCGGCNLPVGG